jgi:predicted dehydrogenase
VIAIVSSSAIAYYSLPLLCFGNTAHAVKLAWWNKSISCGPVVEQATHFVDLVRFIAGEGNEVVESSIQATSVEHDEVVGHLSKLSFDEETIEPLKRVPRITTAFWKHKKVRVGGDIRGD